MLATRHWDRLGNGGLTFTELGFGAAPIGNLFKALTDDEAHAVLQAAWDAGVRYFDTARVYGESEQIFGRGLRGVRENCYVATKCHVTDPAKVRETLEKSLAELDMSYVDCVQIHSPCIEAVGFEGAMKVHAELVKLRDEKMLRFIGLTTHIAFETVLRSALRQLAR